MLRVSVVGQIVKVTHGAVDTDEVKSGETSCDFGRGTGATNSGRDSFCKLVPPPNAQLDDEDHADLVVLASGHTGT